MHDNTARDRWVLFMSCFQCVNQLGKTQTCIKLCCIYIAQTASPFCHVNLHLAQRFRVATVDASLVATRHGIGSKTQPIVNTAIVGAFAAFSGIVSLDSVCEAIAEEVPMRIEQNALAAREAAEALVVMDYAEVGV